jgi:hypothetical protein
LNDEETIANDLLHNNEMKFIQVGNETEDTDGKDYRLYIAKPISPFQNNYIIADYMTLMPDSWKLEPMKQVEHYYKYMALEIAKGDGTKADNILNEYSLSEFIYKVISVRIYNTLNQKGM